ncbi:MAG: YbhB/YbcL family Raf kinase inhibitor-like protein [Candidatus Korobacteraceae bacterium]
MISAGNISAPTLLKHFPLIAKLAVLLLLLEWIGGSTVAAQANPSAGASPMTLALKSSAFEPAAEIPKKHTCDAADVSPALEWSGLPPRTVSFVLVMDDPDAPNGTWVHWVMWNLSTSAHELREGVPKRDPLDGGTRQGRNSFGKIGYNGPCPPRGKPHRYFFRLYALDEKLDLAPGSSNVVLQQAIKDHIIVEADYMGTYKR